MTARSVHSERIKIDLDKTYDVYFTRLILPPFRSVFITHEHNDDISAVETVKVLPCDWKESCMRFSFKRRGLYKFILLTKDHDFNIKEVVDVDIIVQ